MWKNKGFKKFLLTKKINFFLLKMKLIYGHFY